MPPPPHHPWTSDEVRRAFIEFFKSRPAPGAGGHAFVPSSPVVPLDDPTLLFTNAGMNQFKPIFLGTVDPASPLGKLKRAANSQKCIRAGGKHNDLEDVGKDTYHHTFFEMLGNWSFGDYFKTESIGWGFELLTKVYGIPADRLYATYFQGEPKLGLEPDIEARDLWQKLLPRGHVLPGNMKDNFWEMGETGPCGPCSEVHFDRIGGRDASALVNTGDPDVLEIWNHVFIQFNREGPTSLKTLPAKHVDTGMGLERLVSVLQNVRSNYDTDLFAPIFAAIERLTGARPYMGRLGAADEGNVDTAYRVVADHIRTLTFALTDGAVPSNEGRGYVLRRILRRGVRFGRQMLGAKGGFFSQLVPVIIEKMGGAFPELRKDPERIASIIREEEESFGKTLDKGLRLWTSFAGGAFYRAAIAYQRSRPPHEALEVSVGGGFEQSEAINAELDQHRVSLNPGEVRDDSEYWFLDRASGKFVVKVRFDQLTPTLVKQYSPSPPVIEADAAFKLFDTYGFPIDLTVLMAQERGLTVDIAGYEKLMEEARERSRGGGGAKESEHKALDLPADAIARLRHMHVDPTDDADKFHGRNITAVVKAIWNGENFDQNLRPGSRGTRPVGLILDSTNFYAEMGGQVADHGRMTVIGETRGADIARARGIGGGTDAVSSGEFAVEDVRAFGGYVVHSGHGVRGEIRVGDRVALHVDAARRVPIAANHTGTHLLNFGLRKVLGGHVDQKGSMVAPDRLRFDFANSGPVTPEQIEKVEGVVREAITADLPVYADTAPLHVAKQVAGLRAVFGEAYPDPVRVVSIGRPVKDLIDEPGNLEWNDYSVELCGGTHLPSTGAAEEFAVVSEEAVAKGVRRVVALTGVPAKAAIIAADSLADRLKAAGSLVGADLQHELAAINHEMEQLTLPVPRKAKLRAGITALAEKVKAAQKQAAAGRRTEAAAAARSIGEAAKARNEPVVVATLELGSDRGAIEQAVKTIRDLCPAAAVMVLSPDEAEAKVSVMAGVPPPGVQRGLSAGDWVRETARVLGGKGGGRPDAAQGAGPDLAKLTEAQAVARAFAAGKLGA
ncbi:MAG: alanine--tRNA ligase [Phycisphaerales bacterium]